MAALIQQLKGHSRQKALLQQARQEQKIPSGYLFAGLEGIGKKLMALSLAQNLLCENSEGASGACGVCGSCHRVAMNTSESVLVIDTEELQLKLDDVKPIHEFLNLRAISSYRIIILDQAQKLNPSAANSILKILEEPPENVLFVFISPSSYQIMPTLLSRLQMIHFFPLEEEYLKTFGDFADWMIQASAGSVAKLMQLNDPDEIKVRNLALKEFEKWLCHPEVMKEPSWRENYKDRDHLMSLSKYFLSFLRDLSLIQNPTEFQMMNPDQKDYFIQISNQQPHLEFRNLIQKVLTWQQELNSTRDPLMVSETLWVRTPANLF